jgi:hypothetical protein
MQFLLTNVECPLSMYSIEHTLPVHYMHINFPLYILCNRAYIALVHPLGLHVQAYLRLVYDTLIVTKKQYLEIAHMCRTMS